MKRFKIGHSGEFLIETVILRPGHFKIGHSGEFLIF
jgi:hypothetical protein